MAGENFSDNIDNLQIKSPEQTRKEFEEEKEIAQQAFEQAGFKAGDTVDIKKWDGKKEALYKGWKIEFFTLIEIADGKKEPAARVINPDPKADIQDIFSTIPLSEMIETNKK